MTPMLPRPIVIATGNPHKVDELRAVFARAGVGVIGLGELAGARAHEPEEHGSTFEQNAAIKALGYAAQTGRLCLADDSGLEIDALGGRPGVISSHYCTDGREARPPMSRDERDAANNARVLRELEARRVPADERSARFVCVMALAEPGRVLHTARGALEGRIGAPPRVPAGANGFGYDPLFLVGPPHGDWTRTSAQMGPSEKNRISHRAEAAEAMAAWIREHAVG